MTITIRKANEEDIAAVLSMTSLHFIGIVDSFHGILRW